MEANLIIFDFDERQYMWRKPNETLQKKNLQSTVKRGGHVMVWGCMSASGVGKLDL